MAERSASLTIEITSDLSRAREAVAKFREELQSSPFDINVQSKGDKVTAGGKSFGGMGDGYEVRPVEHAAAAPTVTANLPAIRQQARQIELALGQGVGANVATSLGGFSGRAPGTAPNSAFSGDMTKWFNTSRVVVAQSGSTVNVGPDRPQVNRQNPVEGISPESPEGKAMRDEATRPTVRTGKPDSSFGRTIFRERLDYLDQLGGYRTPAEELSYRRLRVREAETRMADPSRTVSAREKAAEDYQTGLGELDRAVRDNAAWEVVKRANRGMAAPQGVQAQQPSYVGRLQSFFNALPAIAAVNAAERGISTANQFAVGMATVQNGFGAAQLQLLRGQGTASILDAATLGIIPAGSLLYGGMDLATGTSARLAQQEFSANMGERFGSFQFQNAVANRANIARAAQIRFSGGGLGYSAAETGLQASQQGELTAIRDRFREQTQTIADRNSALLQEGQQALANGRNSGSAGAAEAWARTNNAPAWMYYLSQGQRDEYTSNQARITAAQKDRDKSEGALRAIADASRQSEGIRFGIGMTTLGGQSRAAMLSAQGSDFLAGMVGFDTQRQLAFEQIQRGQAALKDAGEDKDKQTAAQRDIDEGEARKRSIDAEQYAARMRFTREQYIGANASNLAAQGMTYQAGLSSLLAVQDIAQRQLNTATESGKADDIEAAKAQLANATAEVSRYVEEFGRQIKSATISVEGQTTVSRLSRTGFTLSAQMASIDSERQAAIAADGQYQAYLDPARRATLTPEQQAYYAAQEARFGERRSAARQAENALNFRTAANARTAAVYTSGAGSMAAQRAQLANDYASDVFGLDVSSAAFRRRTQQYNADRSRLEYDQRFAQTQTRIGLTGEGRAASLRLGRNFAGADAIDQATSEAQRIRDIANQFGAGSEEERLARQNALGRLASSRQEYLLGFRGEQFNPFEMMPFNPRDTQNPDEVMNAFREAQKTISGATLDPGGGSKGLNISDTDLKRIGDAVGEAIARQIANN